MKMRKIPEDLSTTIRDIDNFVVLTHVHPDGDALGSLLGFAEIMEKLGKQVFCYLEEPVSSLYDFMPDCVRIHTDLADLRRFIEKADGRVAAISLDCGDCERLGENQEELLKIHPFLAIDHHRAHKEYGDFRWIESDCSSTGEMVYELAQVLGADISRNCAINLYVAISTDTGSFRYESTTSRTLKIAADLVERGARPDEVASHLHENFTFQRLKLMELVLSTLQLYESGQLAFIRVTNDMFDKSGASFQDVEGFIDYPRSLRSVKVAIFIKERKNCQISVSLRAKGECDVAEIAQSFGGGGHRNAAGFRFTGKTVEDAHSEVLAALRKSLNH
jgi:bifunctional oligoribonuclease and PAP phosphatase NrnA